MKKNLVNYLIPLANTYAEVVECMKAFSGFSKYRKALSYCNVNSSEFKKFAKKWFH